MRYDGGSNGTMGKEEELARLIVEWPIEEARSYLGDAAGAVAHAIEGDWSDHEKLAIACDMSQALSNYLAGEYPEERLDDAQRSWLGALEDRLANGKGVFTEREIDAWLEGSAFPEA